MSDSIDPETIVLQFNDGINDRDVERLARLMSVDHTFVDTEGGVVSGKEDCLRAWQSFFDHFADYRNVFNGLQKNGDTVIAWGNSVCSNKQLDGPALWTARVRNGALAEWCVYEDTPANRRMLGISLAD
jgi:ketosteroid isomerase-like protein